MKSEDIAVIDWNSNGDDNYTRCFNLWNKYITIGRGRVYVMPEMFQRISLKTKLW